MPEILVVLGLAAVWLAMAIPIYRILRRLIVRGAESPARSALFTLICGALAAPGLLSLGHPPPIPVPGAAVLGPAYLWWALQGHGGSDSLTMVYINLASWALVTASIGLGELWRFRRRVLATATRWVIPGICVAAAMALFFVLNGPVGEPARLNARVIACGPQPHWLTRIKTQSCAAELEDYSIVSFAESDIGVYGRMVTILRFQRRFVGTHDIAGGEAAGQSADR
jgi:hypothetical protein